MAAESDVLCEIEVLQSIYLDELEVTQKDDGGWQVSLVLHPSTGEDCLSQFVRLTLTLDLDSEYPSCPPCISIHNPRGLSDDKLLSLQQSLQREAESCLGMPVLYQLIEKAKEILTESNIPHGNCVICLYGFKEGEVFTKTSCYHYFHSHCLGRYITHSELELRERERELEEDKSRDRGEEQELSVVCPVCREPLSYDMNMLLSSPAPVSPEEDEALGAEFKRKWEKLQKILDRQKEKGGVIDPEAESNRFLIHINEAPAYSETTLPEDLEPSQLLDPVPPEIPNQILTPQARNISTQPQLRNLHGRRQQGEFRGRGRGRGRGKGGGERRECSTVVENLTKLSLSSVECDRRLPQSSVHPQNNAECTEQGQSLEVKANEDHSSPNPTSEECVSTSTSFQDSSADKQEQPNHSNTTTAENATEMIVTDSHPERGLRDRGRRHSQRPPQYQWHERPPRGSNQWDNPGNPYHHRGGRGYRARGGGFSHHHHHHHYYHYYKGGGTHRGTGKGTHPKSETDFKKEGVL
ncbi:E3 ubiquitin-protein ligase RNF25 isoform X2 [Hoplias malabaricus]|uniref:E3 ubiquitin-protein ligase RNF25 isoform X2 n=1 Tax=Hoplias malabaricus TaxID=27720 RepID=UPI003462EB53